MAMLKTSFFVILFAIVSTEGIRSQEPTNLEPCMSGVDLEGILKDLNNLKKSVEQMIERMTKVNPIFGEGKDKPMENELQLEERKKEDDRKEEEKDHRRIESVSKEKNRISTISTIIPYSLSTKQVEHLLESTVTSENHLIHEMSQWTTSLTLSWTETDSFHYFSLPKVVGSNTVWKVNFNENQPKLQLQLLCESVDENLFYTRARVFGFFEKHPKIWSEGSFTPKCNEYTNGISFTKQFSELPKERPLRIHVSVKWSHISYPILTPIFWNSGPVLIRYRWKLRGWKSINPTANRWRVSSTIFELGDTLWSMAIEYMNGKKLGVGLHMWKPPKSAGYSMLSCESSLSLWNSSLQLQKENMHPKLHFNGNKRSEDECSDFKWNIINSSTIETRDPIDLILVLRISKKS